MAETGMAHVPPGFQVLVQKINQRVAKLERDNEALKQRMADMEAELQRRRGGRPTHKGSEAA